MAELIITRGLPASGKTTWAKAWVAEDVANRARVNRDDFRAMLHPSGWHGKDVENRVRKLRDATIRELLLQGVSVVCDDTNLPQDTANEVASIGYSAGAIVRVHDMTDVPFDVCMARNEARSSPVPAKVVEDMHAKFLRGGRKLSPIKSAPEKSPNAVYTPDLTKQIAIIVDLDGTLALHNGRSPYDETLVSQDSLNTTVATVLASVADHHGAAVLACSGRSENCRTDTEAWLRNNAVPFDHLFMRAAGDQRKDSVVKREIFDTKIRKHFNVLLVIDDRNSVVAMWRSLGLTCFQVADGNF